MHVLLDVVALAVLAVSIAIPTVMFFRKPKLHFAGKHVLITGGSTGIGFALAQQLIAKGAHLTLIARSHSKLDAAKKQLLASKADATVHTVSADVTNCQQVQQAISQAETSQGPIYCLICSAGSSTPGKFLAQDVSVFSDTMQLNYMGCITALKAALPGMVQRKEGHVILISSVMAIIGFTGYASYAPSKWAVRGLADCLRNELVGSGVGVSIAYPPDTDTPGYETEKSLMPADGRQIQDLGGATLFKPEQVARGILKGASYGQYHLRGPDFGLNLLVSAAAGFTPRMYNWLLELFVAPVMVLLSRLAVMLADRVVRKHAATSQGGQP